MKKNFHIFQTPHFLHSAFSTLSIFHTPHFPHSSFSTLFIFHTPHFPHSALRIIHRTLYFDSFLLICISFVLRTTGHLCFLIVSFVDWARSIRFTCSVDWVPRHFNFPTWWHKITETLTLYLAVISVSKISDWMVKQYDWQFFPQHKTTSPSWDTTVESHFQVHLQLL